MCILKLISWRKEINHSPAASASQQLMTPMSVIRVQKNRLIILDKETNGTFCFLELKNHARLMLKDKNLFQTGDRFIKQGKQVHVRPRCIFEYGFKGLVCLI